MFTDTLLIFIGLFLIFIVLCLFAMMVWLYVNYPYLLTEIILGFFGVYILYHSIKKDKQ